MSATIVLVQNTKESPYMEENTVTSIGLKDIDDHNSNPVDYPISIPTSGTNYSYEAWLRFKCTVAPDNHVKNFKIWGSGGSIATGVDFTINTDDPGSYPAGGPVKTQSTAGTRDNLENHGSGSKITVDGDLTGSGQYTDYMVFQEEVLSSASPGDIPEQTINYSYDEN